MIYIKPGTTPILVIDVPNIDTTTCSNIQVTIKQYPVELTKVGEIVSDIDTIYVPLSEDETRIFKRDEECIISVRLETNDGSIIKTDRFPVHILDTISNGMDFGGVVQEIKEGLDDVES